MFLMCQHNSKMVQNIPIYTLTSQQSEEVDICILKILDSYLKRDVNQWKIVGTLATQQKCWQSQEERDSQAPDLWKPCLWYPSPRITVLFVTPLYHSLAILFRNNIWSNFRYISIWTDISRAFGSECRQPSPPSFLQRPSSWEPAPQKPQYL